MRFLFEDYALDTDRHELRRGADLVAVPPQVFDLLHYLIRNRERVVSKDDLIAGVWGGRIVSDSALTTRINAARSAIGDSGEAQRLIKTVPRKGIRFVAAVREEQAPPAAAVAASPAEPPKPALALPDKPSIAVLPFANLSSDPEQEYFTDGIVGDIITELSRFSGLFVIARNSSFTYKGKPVDVRQVGRDLGVRYVLEGSIRRDGERLRMTAQLNDTLSGAHRWAERYDRHLRDLFDVQDEIARTIAGVVAAHIDKAELDGALLRPPASLQAYDCYLRGVSSHDAFYASFRSIDHLYQARRWLEQAIAIDPRHARAYAALAVSYVPTYLYKHDADYFNPVILERMRGLALKAIELDPKLPDGHSSLGHALSFQAQHDASIAAHERALALNPNRVNWRFATTLVHAGQHERAIEVTRACMRLDPFYPPTAPGWLGFAYFMLERYSEALPPLLESTSRASGWQGGLLFLAATYARLGDIDKARAVAAELLRLIPEYTMDMAQRLNFYRRPEDAEHFFGGLRLAGLPE